ncbi:MAG TPA: outer membrane beta-barrel protein, partial [Hymenobacter sp.]|nr:outer membrane beta-barrel protein [Hymenobacter sp.]
MSRALPHEQRLQLSYSRRINPPDLPLLLLFPNYGDPRNYRVGNIRLLLENINALKLSHQKSWVALLSINDSCYIGQPLHPLFQLCKLLPRMTTSLLLAELETETHSNRVKRMVALGRQARTNAEIAALLQILADSSGSYERLLALFSCHGSSNGAHVIRALADESRFVRSLAVKMVAHVCTDEQTLSAFAHLTRKSQMVLLRTLLQHQRRALIDNFLAELAANADERLSLFLFFGTEAIIRQHVDSVSSRWGTDDWVRLAKFHPIIAFARLHDQLQKQTASNTRLLLHVNAVIPPLSQSQPDNALILVRELLRHETPARIELQCVAERKINEVAELLLTHEDGGAARLNASRLAPRLSGARLLALLQHRPTFVSDREAWLSRVSPEVRSTVFALAGNGWQSKQGVISATIIALLPRQLREAEARRHLALPALATRPTNRLAYASFLPWDEARALLDPFLRNPDPELRSIALSALIGVARYYRSRLPEVLTLIHARANEQDPIRRAMLAALAVLPPSRWQASHLEELGHIISDALNAADLSQATAHEAEKIVVALVPFHPEWAAPWISTLAQSRGQVHFSSLGDRLTDADVRRIAPTLLPVLQAWATREREYLLVQAAGSLGRRLRVFDELV